MNFQPFKHRSSQVLALFRVLLASLFGIWVWLYPEQPVFGGETTYLVILLYIAYAIGIFFIAKYDWWLDNHFALPAFVVDVTGYLAALHITQAAIFDFISPFITFFAFLMISAAVRWSQRILPVVAVVLGGSFLLAGLILQMSGVEINLLKFVMRFSYLGVLSLILMWFALNRSPYQVHRFTRQSAGAAASPYADALAFAMEASGASGAALVWVDDEHPRSLLHVAGKLGESSLDQLPPTFDPSGCKSPMLFDTRHDRTIALAQGGRLVAGRQAEAMGLASHLTISEGVLVPLQGSTGKGQLVLSGITGLCWDDIMVGSSIAREIAQGLDEGIREGLAREMAVSRVRTSLARDLHDSVAQSLAGTRFRLDSLREMAREGKDVLPELDTISDNLRLEQEQIRAVIDQLRRSEPGKGRFELRDELSELARFLAEHWQIDVAVDDAGKSVVVPQALGYEFQQIMREAVANAARHGAARNVDFQISRDRPDEVTLVIADDGTGFPHAADLTLPRSLSERVAAMGGTLALASASNPTRLEIHIPAKANP